MNVVEIIKKLNSIDAKELKKINVADQLDLLREKPEVVLIIISVLFTLFGSIYLISTRGQIKKNLIREIKTHEQKLEIVNSNNSFKKKFHDFLNRFPETITQNQFIDVINQLSSQYDVTISSIKPTSETTDDIIIVDKVSVKSQSDDFINLLKFISHMESSAYAVRAEEFRATSKLTSRDDPNQMQLNLDMTFGVINFIDEGLMNNKK